LAHVGRGKEGGKRFAEFVNALGLRSGALLVAVAAVDMVCIFPQSGAFGDKAAVVDGVVELTLVSEGRSPVVDKLRNTVSFGVR
jgi:hypothetical protein